MAILLTNEQLENEFRRSANRPVFGQKTYSGSLTNDTVTLDFSGDLAIGSSAKKPSGSGWLTNDGPDSFTLKFNPDSTGLQQDITDSTETYELKSGETIDWGKSTTDLKPFQIHITVAAGKTGAYRGLAGR